MTRYSMYINENLMRESTVGRWLCVFQTLVLSKPPRKEPFFDVLARGPPSFFGMYA